ncbi:MAG TPA: penicillin-binding transpeptidase domain-containing protein, partial [Terriglobales bacterium]|nr:penicillin-binding transpeptidase domain-containing protein [Terriglobales bacterium]
RRALSPAIAYLITDTLRDAVQSGTSRVAADTGLADRVAGKTGTTNSGTDAWFIGFTSEIVIGVWLGFDDPKPIVASASAGQLAAPVCSRVLRRIYGRDHRPLGWEPPEPVYHRLIDPGTGLPLARGCWPRFGSPKREYFIEGVVPRPHCPGREPPPQGYVTGAQSIEWDALRQAGQADAAGGRATRLRFAAG